MDRNWVASSLAVDLDKIESGLGLDACMAIKYSSFGAQLMLTIGLLATVGLPWATRVFLAFRTVICCMLRGLERVAVVSVCLKFRGYWCWYRLPWMWLQWLAQDAKSPIIQPLTPMVRRRRPWTYRLVCKLVDGQHKGVPSMAVSSPCNRCDLGSAGCSQAGIPSSKPLRYKAHVVDEGLAVSQSQHGAGRGDP